MRVCRPLGVGLQEQASKHLKLHWSRAIVVSVEEKACHEVCQLRIRETSTSELLMRCRKLKATSKLVAFCTPGQIQGQPAYCLGGVRHKGSVTLIQAFVWNVGTCRSDVKGETQVEDPQE